MNSEKPHSSGRRCFLGTIVGSFVGLALTDLLARDGKLTNRLHHPARAKRVIQLFMAGAALHMHRAIDGADLEMTHVTERKGSPFTLIITKTRRNYEAKLSQFKRDLRAAERLIEDVPVSTSKLAVELGRNLTRAA